MNSTAPVLEGLPAAESGLWNVTNAAALNILIMAILAALFYGLTHISNYTEVRNNWSKYRCDPSIMPFASFYGYNAVDNFNYCLGAIFAGPANETAGSFMSLIGGISTMLGSVFSSLNSLRVSVATLGGGINVIFQDFTDRISSFFFRLRMSAIRMKMLMGRMYAILFSIMYMGMSGLTGMSTLGNTTLFRFVDDMACFPPWQLVDVAGRGLIRMADVQCGDRLAGGGQVVTGVFRFYAKNQPMVRLPGDIYVSNNHYLVGPTGTWIRADEHPDAVAIGGWRGDELVCLNTDVHTMNIGQYIFRDFDESDAAHIPTMGLVESMVNGAATGKPVSRPYREYTPAVPAELGIRLADGRVKPAGQLAIGERLASGGYVIATADRQVTEIAGDEKLAAATLVWNSLRQKWERQGDNSPIICLEKPTIYKAFLVTPNSQIELASGKYIRDYIEICSGDIEVHYSNDLRGLQTTQ
jgi:hypothetical protein